jgi:hypothetical protein
VHKDDDFPRLQQHSKKINKFEAFQQGIFRFREAICGKAAVGGATRVAQHSLVDLSKLMFFSDPGRKKCS